MATPGAAPTGAQYGSTGSRTPRRRRGGCLVALLVVGLAVALAAVLAVTTFAFRRTDRTSRTIDQPVRSVSVDSSGGSVSVVAGPEPTVRFTTSEHYLLRRPNIETAVVGDELQLRGNCARRWLPFGCAIDYEVQVQVQVQVPASVAVRASSSAGAIPLSGVNAVSMRAAPPAD
jgi:hypothetical protein